MNKIDIMQVLGRMCFMLTCMALPANGNLVTAIQPDVFIEQALHLKAQAKGLTHWGLSWNLVDGDGKSEATAITISIHPTSNDARGIFDAYRNSCPVGSSVVESKNGPGECYSLQYLRVSFVRNNVLIIIELDVENKREPARQWFSEKGGITDKQRLFEKARLMDKALQQNPGAPGVTRGDKVDAVVIDEVIWRSQFKESWKIKAHRESAPHVQAQGEMGSMPDMGGQAFYFSTDDCVYALKNYPPEVVVAIVKEVKAREAREQAAAELPEKKKKTEAALAVLKNVGSTQGDCLGAIHVLEETKFPSMVPVLLNEMKSSKFPSVRTNAAGALAEFKDKRTIPVFLKILENPPTSGFDSKRVEDSREVGIRCAAARGLGNIGDPVALPVLRKVLSREKEFQRVRQEAMHAVGAMKDRQSAAMILKVIASPPIGNINQEDRSEEENYRKEAIRAVSEIGGEAALPALQMVADNELEYPRLRKYARENIGRIQYDAKEAKRLEELKKNPQE